jgi:hypothetical protein
MDVRRAQWFITWKGGVELQLYNFQLAQSKHRIAAPMVANKPAQSPTRITPPVTEQHTPSATITAPNYGVPVDAWEDLNFITGSNDNPLEDCPPIRNTLVASRVVNTPDHIGPLLTTMQLPEMAVTTPAATFMQERPAGPVQTTTQQMKALERRVTAQLQKKGPTATEGRQVLVGVSSKARQDNKENEPITGPKRTSKVTRTATMGTQSSRRAKRPKVSASKPGKYKPPATQTVTAPVVDHLLCTYGCAHGGLVGLKQMMPYDTKFYLEKGNYLDSKCCIDCTTSIATVFQASKNKALLYYCPIDYNVDNLQDDNTAVADAPCSCILCITCYFAREEKKTAASGKATRSSGRGRKP